MLDVQEKQEIFEVGPDGMGIDELAKVLAVNPSEVVKKLFVKGVYACVNQQLDMETVQIAAAAFGAEAIEADVEVRCCW
jgi:translation initiation factor IF-2